MSPNTHKVIRTAETYLVLSSFVLSSLIASPAGGVVAPAGRGLSQAAGFANFESFVTNPIRLSPDGTRMFVANTPNASVSVFDISVAASPKLLKEIPVGVEPTSVNPVSDDVVWVVNQVSDSVSVVSVSQGIVTETVHVPDEPIDVVFAAGNAYISLSRSNAVAVVNATTFANVAKISLFGGSPRAMAVSPSGKDVYALFAIAGNKTTLIPSQLAPPPPAPTNPLLPPAPQVSLIVNSTNPVWAPKLPYTMPANGVAVIDTTSHALSGYFSSVGTINQGLGVSPVTGDLFIGNMDSLNVVEFEPNVRAHFVNNRITRVRVASGTITAFDLNPNVNYNVLPNPAALTTALAEPTSVVVDPGGSFMYVAAFGTDRIAWVDTNGNVLSFLEVSGAAGSGPNADPANKKGPRALALNAAAHVLYSYNRISNTISIIDTNQKTVTSEIAVGTDPTPAVIKNGRGFLYDAKLSGNGTGSCASCHVDGEIDHLAWNLGNPAGDLQTVIENGQTITFHPMKGPMTTQTFRGLNNLAPYHWRGDHANFAAFNSAFDTLLGSSQLSTSDMTAYTNFVNTILFQANPNENLDRTLPATFNGGNPNQGVLDYDNLVLTNLISGKKTCNSCHLANPGNGPGSNLVIDAVDFTPQPLKNPHLRNVYQKLLFNKNGPTTVDGFGLDHDGFLTSLADFFQGRAFTLYNAKQALDISAYLMCFDTGTAPGVGYTRTLTSQNVGTQSAQSDWNTLESQAAAGNIDLIARGTIQGNVHGLLYQPASKTYTVDGNTKTLTQAQVQALIVAGDTLSIMGVYPGTGTN